MGGLAGNQATKGGRYDTVATIAGAIIGGVGAREATGQWEEKKQEKKQKKRKEHEEIGWGGGHDRHGHDRHDGHDRYDDRESYRRHGGRRY